jgi:hypothetical protein
MSLNYKIINKKPAYVINKKSPIGFVFFHTENIFIYSKYSLEKLKKYCKKHEYGLIVYEKPLNLDMMPCWNKIACVLLNLKKFKYLVWIDADAMICNDNIKIEDLIGINKNKDLLICKDIFSIKESINSGVMIIKNTPWAYKLFKNTWNNEYPHLHNDQNIILYEILKDNGFNLYFNFFKYNIYFIIINLIANKEIHPKVLIFEQKYFNCHLLSFSDNYFVLHLMGFNNTDRKKIFKIIYKNKKINFSTLEKIFFLFRWNKKK